MQYQLRTLVVTTYYMVLFRLLMLTSIRLISLILLAYLRHVQHAYHVLCLSVTGHYLCLKSQI